jgi:murein DD-endopeptidase MepM/ murein hydrolase activator NlpD
MSTLRTTFRLSCVFTAVALSLQPQSALGQFKGVLPFDTINSVLLHPVVRQHYVCLEHPVGQLTYVGDALGSDCLIIDLGGGSGKRFPSFYRGTGSRNADWYGWNQLVLAPFDGLVDSVHTNENVNQPGNLGRARAGVIVFLSADGVRVLYAHVHAIAVKAGDRVRAGQPVARVGNNGPSVMPHTHVGAWRGKEPLQIRFDLRAAAKLSRMPETVPSTPLPDVRRNSLKR